ncbi:transferrin-binding protein-like solute binding protein [Altererythrobacter sp. SALINAS58]|uniref:transferrin-binding protein-like solute binding protein n=1 Tax=Alteripontixanthobacter muriae TaxID=2705546 RepID=UPI001576897E|nr:transferrin-binding protein-like solute binding protein [Alteripontixanthobacter muriae]NTZ41777.1 transferrin-binding protein-like solute binding protein [Alteripontixanthobacter muriae]
MGPDPSQDYVALGFRQQNRPDGDDQGVEFTTFTYGFRTDAAGVPRTGQAAYGIDVFGVATKPGEEPVSFDGSGKFSVNFFEGSFLAQASTTEYGLVTDYGVSGGGIELNASGMLSATDGSFSGLAAYGSGYGQTSGTIFGRFYGPSAQEVGASFQTNGADGLAAVGSFVGATNDTLVPENMSFTSLSREQRFYTLDGGSVGGLTWLNSETFDFQGYSSDMGGGRFTAADKIAGKSTNFRTYAKTVDDGYGAQDVVLELYENGSANTEISLTYASFGHWSGTRDGGTRDEYFHYGFLTGRNLLTARTGTARYAGVLYGTGVNSDASRKYDIRGTSAFNIDFSNQIFGGNLTATGTEQSSGVSANFGSFAVDGTVFSGASALEGLISRGGMNLGSFNGSFYGPDGQDMAGSFYFNAPAGTGDALEVGIKGVTVTKRQ